MTVYEGVRKRTGTEAKLYKESAERARAKLEKKMTRAGEKMLAGARDALAAARGDIDVIREIKVTPSCGCVLCDLGIERVKLRRRFVHHFPEKGRTIVCGNNLKPRGA